MVYASLVITKLVAKFSGAYSEDFPAILSSLVGQCPRGVGEKRGLILQIPVDLLDSFLGGGDAICAILDYPRLDIFFLFISFFLFPPVLPSVYSP
jgi:hypothetical protein